MGTVNCSTATPVPTAGEWGVSCGERQRKDIDLPSFLLHVLDSTGFGESEEISSWGKGELE